LGDVLHTVEGISYVAEELPGFGRNLLRFVRDLTDNTRNLFRFVQNLMDNMGKLLRFIRDIMDHVGNLVRLVQDIMDNIGNLLRFMRDIMDDIGGNGCRIWRSVMSTKWSETGCPQFRQASWASRFVERLHTVVKFRCQ
jgi:hypothetical protein